MESDGRMAPDPNALTESERKRRLALDAADARLVTWRPADVRWLSAVAAERGFPDEWRLHHQPTS